MTKKSTQPEPTEVQTSAQNSTPVNDEDVVNSIVTDKHAGMGGSYVYDPETKTRTPA